jgi:hypothetical protein
VFSAAIGTETWVLFVLLITCYVATNNIKVFSAALEKPTMGSFRIVNYLPFTYQQYKMVQCCYGNAKNVL